MRAQWLPLKVGGEWNPELRRLFATSSGVYAFRRKGSRVVEYVGESHTGRGWKTLQRHFQDQSGAFADRSEYAKSDANPYECAVWVTSSGPRDKKNGDQGALDLQAKLIARYKPTENRDDGQAYENCPHGTSSQRCAKHRLSPVKAPPPSEDAEPLDGDDDFAFGANVNPAIPPPNVAAEKRAENRTPDLFTGRTKLEEGGKAARRDYKGEAERLSRELAECRRAPSSPPREAPATPKPKPRKLPEGFGELDDIGQSTMFKRNPPATLATPAERAEFLYHAGRVPDRVTVHEYKGGSSSRWELHSEGRVIVRDLRSRAMADWVLDAFTAANVDAKIHNKVSELIGPPPNDSRDPWQAARYMSGEGYAFSIPEDDRPVSECTTERAAMAQFIAELANIGLAFAKSSDEQKHARDVRRSLEVTHRLNVGDRITWEGYRNGRPVDHTGTIAELLRDDRLVVKPWFTKKRGGKQALFEQGAHTVEARYALLIPPAEKPAPKPRKPRAKAAPPAPPPAAIAAPPPAGYGEEEKGRRAGQLRMFNPGKGAAPVVLGELVSLGYRTSRGALRAITFPAGSCLVAVAASSRLVLVFRPKPAGSSSAASRKAYAVTHWGRDGDGERLTGDTLAGSAPTLGELLEITYATQKGADPELVDYWHTFGDLGGGRMAKNCKLPALEGEKVGGRLLLRIAGGSYKVTSHGIVG